ncbi:MAG: DUF4160 domain-containing protein [Dechloromonas sp.]|nr:DUF4160 domain-containing protein [Dechloromonas sp.]
MPVVFRYNGIRFHFFSNEGDPREPLHIHAQPGDCLAKIWLQPELRLADNFGFSASELRVILEQVALRAPEIERSWNEFFG